MIVALKENLKGYPENISHVESLKNSFAELDGIDYYVNHDSHTLSPCNKSWLS